MSLTGRRDGDLRGSNRKETEMSHGGEGRNDGKAQVSRGVEGRDRVNSQCYMLGKEGGSGRMHEQVGGIVDGESSKDREPSQGDERSAFCCV